MEKEIKDLLENEVLGDEVKTALQEAFDNKVKVMEQKLQEDYAARYNHDKAVLVEAMDKMLSDSIRKELEEFAEDRSAMIKQRAKLSQSVMESKKLYAKKLKEHIHMLNSFVTKQVKDEISEFVADRKSLAEQRRQMAVQLQTIKESTRREYAERINKLEGFVLKQLSEEIGEFHADKKALVEQRVKLARLGKQKLQETREQFIQRATASVDNTLNEVIRKELVQWRDDIKVARENNFGRKIFEAVAAEYMASYLSEGSEVKKLTRQLQEQREELAKATQQLDEQKKLMESANATAKTHADRLQRVQTMNELLSPLSRDKKAIMEDLLRDIKTSNLREAFNRYLPTVVHGRDNVPSKQPLAETRQPQQTTKAVTGDRTNTLTKAVLEESKQNDDLGVILHLAGIKN